MLTAFRRMGYDVAGSIGYGVAGARARARFRFPGMGRGRARGMSGVLFRVLGRRLQLLYRRGSTLQLLLHRGRDTEYHQD